MVRHSALAAVALLLVAGAALASTSLLSDEVFLLRAYTEGSAIGVLVSNLTSPNPLEGWLSSPLVPATVDNTGDRDPDLAVYPGTEDRRLVLVWSKENPSTGSYDIALAFFRIPYLPEATDVLWLTRTPGDETTPKAAVDPKGQVHVVWRGPEGTPEYRVLNERGRAIWRQSGLGLPAGQIEDLDIAVDPEGETWVAVLVSGLEDKVVILSEGDPDEEKPPVGGESILEPLRLDHSEVQNSLIDPGLDLVQPAIQLLDGVPVVTWKSLDAALGIQMLHFRFRMDGAWRPDPALMGNARIPLMQGFDEADAMAAVRDLIRSLRIEREDSQDAPRDLEPGLDGGGLSGRTLR